MDVIQQVRYAPHGEYIKDHCLIRHEKLWHFFSISGSIGCSWLDLGSEESISHSTSSNLVNWQMQGHPIRASGKDGYLDQHMAVAPFVIRGPGGRFFMFFSGWVHPHKLPDFNFDQHRQSIYVAVSDDLYKWRIPDSVAPAGINVVEGESISGRDPHVVRDDANGRWLLYYTEEYMGQRPQGVGVAQSTDLMTWRNLGEALVWKLGDMPFSPTESPFVLRHRLSGKWMLFLNWHYAQSDDPTRFKQVQPLPFACGLDYPATALRGSGKGWASVGVGFAREFIEHQGRQYMSGVLGADGQMKLGFTCIKWTTNLLRLNTNP